MKPGGRGLVVRTLSEQVFQAVRERIVVGQLSGDTPLRQDALAAELGVSKIPLREALARLEQEGLLISRPNRGYVIQPMSSAQAEEIYALRLAVEPPAAARACQLADTVDQQVAEQAFARLDRAALTNLAEVAVSNRDFHTALVRPGGRLLTTQLVERLAILAERYVVAHLRPAGRDERAHREHRDLIDAWIARDARSVEDRLTAHIQATLEDLRSGFDQAPTDGVIVSP